jgi:hypothetical protein
MWHMQNLSVADAVFMVEPTSFGFDEQTALSNVFQKHIDSSAVEITTRAQAEFDSFVATLRAHNIEVIMFRDTDFQPKPNAVFSNNWLSTWPDGRVFLYPMATASRRIERSEAALNPIRATRKISEVSDLSQAEQDDLFLESTGVMVFDHVNKFAYACLSERCNEDLLRTHAAQLGYEPIVFHAATSDGVAIYHTNVMLAIQAHSAVICTEAISDADERSNILAYLRKTSHEVIEISLSQMRNFCGNILEVQSRDGKPCIVMSQSAYEHFTPDQRAMLETHDMLIPVAIPTIEAIGGGSARCMLTEIFLPKLPVTSLGDSVDTLEQIAV